MALVPWRRVAWLTIAISVIVVGAMGIAFHAESHGSAFDDVLSRHLTGWAGVSDLLKITEPALTIGILVALAVGAAALRRWTVLALVALTPLLAIAMTELVLKPLVHRTAAPPSGVDPATLPGAYPSGHEAGFSSILVLVLVLLVRAELSRAVRIAGIVVLAALYVISVIGLVGNGLHYATDTVGSLGVCLASALLIGLTIDAVELGRQRHELLPPASDSARR